MVTNLWYICKNNLERIDWEYLGEPIMPFARTLSLLLAILCVSAFAPTTALPIVAIALLVFGIYLGTLIGEKGKKAKPLLIDLSALFDTRIVDLASSGIVDERLVFPRFLLNELYVQAESPDENVKVRAKRSIEIVKNLGAQIVETDFPQITDLSSKLNCLARFLDAHILTAISPQPQTSDIKQINLHALSNALKPLMHTGEAMKIKIQRYGKEPQQGVGYLEDGTMVVVNGGGQYLGEIVEAKVLSVKHTTSGRMIFCNALDEEGTLQYGE